MVRKEDHFEYEREEVLLVVEEEDEAPHDEEERAISTAENEPSSFETEKHANMSSDRQQMTKNLRQLQRQFVIAALFAVLFLSAGILVVLSRYFQICSKI